MPAPRRRLALALAAATALLVLAGCGAESHPNEQRPGPPVRVSVTLSDGAVLVQPRRVAIGPEKTQQIPQNQNHPQPPIDSDRPLDVVFVTANQTDADANLELRGPTDASSTTIYPRSPGTFQTKLPTGTYVVAAAGLPRARPAKLIVGPFRASSENDVLLP